MSQIRQGTLIDDARAAIGRDHIWQLRVEFSPPASTQGKPRRYVAVKTYGTGQAAALVCRSLANHLRRGVNVRVHAATEDDRRGRSWLMGVDRIEAPDMPSPTQYLAKDDQ